MDRIGDIALFLRVLDLGSISAAARSLDLSVAVASQRLKRLERDLGVRLLHRTTRRLHATPEGAALAEQGRPGVFRFARPMTDRPGLDFSFSGLKTQVLLAWQGSDRGDAVRADIARGFEDAVVDTLSIKCERALDAAGCDTLVVAGGVGANKRLRAKLDEMTRKRGGRVSFPRPQFCTDNGAMIASAGALRLAAGQHGGLAVRVTPRWDMATLEAVVHGS